MFAQTNIASLGMLFGQNKSPTKVSHCAHTEHRQYFCLLISTLGKLGCKRSHLGRMFSKILTKIVDKRATELGLGQESLYRL